jgi:hypothetical protein
MRLLTAESTMRGSPENLTPLHEQLVARSLGLQADDGLVPWAALDAQRLGLTELHGRSGWAWITPCHWAVQSEQPVMDDPLHLGLTQNDSETLWRAMRPYFSEDGITLFSIALGHSNIHWLAHGEVFVDLPTASIDRVRGQLVSHWIPRQEQAAQLRRLQNEMQMLLYIHPVNDSRAHFKLPAVNSFWVSGTGTLAESVTQETVARARVAATVQDLLHLPALRDDAQAWTQAWTTLDFSTLARALEALDRGEPVRITLCGEHQAVTLAQKPLSLWTRLRKLLQKPQPAALLHNL